MAPIIKKQVKTFEKASDTMGSVVQDLRKAGFNPNVGVPFISFVLTKEIDAATSSGFDETLRNPKLAIIIGDIDQFLENRYIIMSFS